MSLQGERSADARYLDVIHTDAGSYGTSRKIGRIDFFPNGGNQQPGCRKL